MATSTTHLILLSLATIISLLAIPTTARPCKTLSFITITYSINIPQNPNNFIHPTQETTIFFNNHQPDFNIHRTRPDFFNDQIRYDRFDPELHSSSSSSVKNSIRDRSKDIMSVFGALMFGVGCGALTAATMYLIWSLFAPNRFELGDSDDEEYDDVSDMKNGYAAIPQVVVDGDDVKPAKEVV